MIGKSPARHVAALHVSGALWNICMGMLQILVPLYALSLGFSIVKISSLVALPVLVELVVRFGGSALSDRFGERRALQSCFMLMALSGTALCLAEGYIHLLLAQALAFCSRSIFWTSIQSLVSQLPGSSLGRKLGRLYAWNHGGGLVGLSAGGAILALVGFPKAFMLLTAVAIFCVLLSLAFPKVEPKPHGRNLWQITWGIGQFLGYRHIWLTISVSFAAAVPATLSQSMYPLYLAFLDYREQWIGMLISLRTLGPLAIGLLLGSFITVSRQKGIYALGMTGLGLFLIVTGLAQNPLFLASAIVALGAAGASMDLLYQVQTAELSRVGDRSVAMASTGLGWILCPFIMPMIVGWLAEEYGFRFAFLVTGLAFVLIAAGTQLWHRLLLPRGAAAFGKSEGINLSTSQGSSEG
ncbi:MAG TPA: MFS transporter [Candidatus Binatia bacterium]|jgi:MFS family permease|nr:MFS transporter [Candidatus Binatia bacterium]